MKKTIIAMAGLASLALMARMGFDEIGVHRNHGKLDGVWKDCVIVELLIPENLDESQPDHPPVERRAPASVG